MVERARQFRCSDAGGFQDGLETLATPMENKLTTCNLQDDRTLKIPFHRTMA